jgi:hypothetical protein
MTLIGGLKMFFELQKREHVLMITRLRGLFLKCFELLVPEESKLDRNAPVVFESDFLNACRTAAHQRGLLAPFDLRRFLKEWVKTDQGEFCTFLQGMCMTPSLVASAYEQMSAPTLYLWGFFLGLEIVCVPEGIGICLHLVKGALESSNVDGFEPVAMPGEIVGNELVLPT